MEYFIKLNKAWQDGINATIQDCDGGERPEVAATFREGYARHLLECKIARKPSQDDLGEIGTSYIDFADGWNAALDKLAKDQMAMIGSWVRAHGEYTDYAPLEGPEFQAYIVKESDLEQAAS